MRSTVLQTKSLTVLLSLCFLFLFALSASAGTYSLRPATVPPEYPHVYSQSPFVHSFYVGKVEHSLPLLSYVAVPYAEPNTIFTGNEGRIATYTSRTYAWTFSDILPTDTLKLGGNGPYTFDAVNGIFRTEPDSEHLYLLNLIKQ